MGDLLLLCVLLWAHEGHEEELAAYEDQVLVLITDHGGRVRSRVRTIGDPAGPTEVQLLQFPSEAALDAYMHDPRRAALGAERDACVARTQVLRVEDA